MTNPAKAVLVGILVIVILGILSTVARAATQCGPESNSRIVVTVNSDTGTWTALTLQGGLACIRAAGLSFSTMPVKPNA